MPRHQLRQRTHLRPARQQRLQVQSAPLETRQLVCIEHGQSARRLLQQTFQFLLGPAVDRVYFTMPSTIFSATAPAGTL